MNMLPIIKISEILEMSPTKLRYWSKLLNLKIIKKGRISYIAEGSENLLSEMKKTVNSGLSPSIAAKEVLSTFAPVVNKEITAPVKHDRLDNLEKAVMLLVESNKKLSEENTLILKKLNHLSVNFLPNRPVNYKKFDVWKPSAKPMIKIPLLKRLFLELFAPEQLRTHPI